MLRNFRYFIAQGFKGLTANSLMTLASVGTVAASLFLFGFFIIFGANLNYIAEQVKEQCEINVYLPKEADRDAVRQVGSELSKIKGVKNVRLYTKEERFQNYKESIYAGQTEVIDALKEDNPLRDAYILELEEVEKADSVAAEAGKVSGIEEVKNSQYIFKKIISITTGIKHASIWLVVILAAVALFIISNTIKLGLFSRRKEINIMKFVGATNWFIRFPFMIEGLLLGIFGAAVAAAIIIFGYGAVLPNLTEFMGTLKLLDVAAVSDMIFVSFGILGAGIGVVGSYMSVRKHLHV